MSNNNTGLKLGQPTLSGMLKPNEAIKQFFTGSFLPVAEHLFQILPDATFVFTVLFSILTQNFALGTLALTLIEAMLTFTLFGTGVNYFMDSKAPQRPEACQAGFPTSLSSYSTLSIFSGFSQENLFPSYPIALVSTLIGYILTALLQYTAELKQLGPGWELRVPIATTLSFLVLTAFVLFRYIAGCENLGVITGTLVIGLLLGTLLTFQNLTFLGKESVNVLGIPILESKTIDGKPLYVCAKAESRS